MVCPTYHNPVMLTESLDALNVREGGVYADLTFGGGGHSRAILGRLGKGGHLYAFDQDEDALAQAPEDGRFTFVLSNFRFLRNWLLYYGEEQVDGILADLGVSSHHFDTPERGFSFRLDAPLDMRMNRRSRLTAREVVNDYSEQSLETILRSCGELPRARQIASAIVKARLVKPIETTGRLAEVVSPSLGKEREKKDMARVFQAIRMEVNGEREALGEMLSAAVESLRQGGRLVVLTYHSIEDRMVKTLMRTGSVDGIAGDAPSATDPFGNSEAPLRPVGKALSASPEEQEANPRSRSARLRVAEKR